MDKNLNKQNEELQVLLLEGAVFEGELRFQGTARLAGRFRGDIKGEEATLIIEPSALVSANIVVDHLILLGNCTGEIQARKTVLMEPPAQFKGEVQTPSLSIKEGVCFEGISKKPSSTEIPAATLKPNKI